MGIIEEIDLVSAYKDLLNGRPVKNSDKFIMKYDGKEYCKKIFIKLRENVLEDIHTLRINGGKLSCEVILLGIIAEKLEVNLEEADLFVSVGRIKEIESKSIMIDIENTQVMGIKTPCLEIKNNKMRSVENIRYSNDRHLGISGSNIDYIAVDDEVFSFSMSESTIRKINIKSDNVAITIYSNTANRKNSIDEMNLDIEKFLDITINDDINGNKKMIINRGKDSTFKIKGRLEEWDIDDKEAKLDGYKVKGWLRISKIGKNKFELLKIQSNSYLVVDTVAGVHIKKLDCFNLANGIINIWNGDIVIESDLILHQLLKTASKTMFDNFICPIKTRYNSLAYRVLRTIGANIVTIDEMPGEVIKQLNKEKLFKCKSTAQLMVEMIDNSSAIAGKPIIDELNKLFDKFPSLGTHSFDITDEDSDIETTDIGVALIDNGKVNKYVYTGRVVIYGNKVNKYTEGVAKYYSNIRMLNTLWNLIEFKKGTVTHGEYGREVIFSIINNKTSPQVILADIHRMLLFDGKEWRIYKVKVNEKFTILKLEQTSDTIDDVIEAVRKRYDKYIKEKNDRYEMIKDISSIFDYNRW